MKLNQETKDFIRQHLTDDIKKLALKKSSNPAIDIPFALQQIEGYQTALKKLPEWAAQEGILFPPKISMEQCSSETTAKYKQALVLRLMQEEQKHLSPEQSIGEKAKTPSLSDRNLGKMADLTGGFGIDFSYLAKPFDTAYYIERQEHLCHMAEHNFATLGLKQAHVCSGNAVDILNQLPDLDLIFIDPARRDSHGKKTYAISDCEPDLSALQHAILNKTKISIAKLSPMLDISLALTELKNVCEIHVVCVDNECKELLFVQTRSEQPSVMPEDMFPVFFCVNIQNNQQSIFKFSRLEEKNATCTYTSRLKSYLYEPNAAIMKAGAYRCLCKHFAIEKLHPNTHLYTADQLIEDFPGRRFIIEDSSSFAKKEIQKTLQDVEQANLTVRNFPETVATLRKKLKLKEGGCHYLFATTLSNEQHILIKCKQMK